MPYGPLWHPSNAKHKPLLGVPFQKSASTIANATGLH